MWLKCCKGGGCVCSLPAWRLFPLLSWLLGQSSRSGQNVKRMFSTGLSPTSLAWPICSIVLCLNDNATALGCATRTSRSQKRSVSVASSSHNFLLMICWFYFRYAHFSCSLWPRLRPVGSQGIAKFLNLVLLFQDNLQKVWQHHACAGAWHDEVPPLPPRAEGVRWCHQHWSAQHPVEDQVFEISNIFWLLSWASTKCCQYLHCTLGVMTMIRTRVPKTLWRICFLSSW